MPWLKANTEMAPGQPFKSELTTGLSSCTRQLLTEELVASKTKQQQSELKTTGQQVCMSHQTLSKSVT